jgi:hypothetical protein
MAGELTAANFVEWLINGIVIGLQGVAEEVTAGK